MQNRLHFKRNTNCAQYAQVLASNVYSYQYISTPILFDEQRRKKHHIQLQSRQIISSKNIHHGRRIK